MLADAPPIILEPVMKYPHDDCFDTIITAIKCIAKYRLPSGYDEGYLYLLNCNCDPRIIKIGATGNVIERYRKIKSMGKYSIYHQDQGVNILAYTYISDLERIEMSIHRALEEYAIGGEWYRLDLDKVYQLAMTINKIV